MYAWFFSIVLTIGLATSLVAQTPDEVEVGPTPIPWYTGNLNVHPFMVHYGTAAGEQPAMDWASPERMAILKRIGVFADCDYQAWSMVEPQPGKWDFSRYIKTAQLVKKAGLDYIPFCWVHYPPQWYLDSPDFVPYRCAEHCEDLIQLSPWSPKVWEVYRSYYQAQKKAMGDYIGWIRVATPSDYGEIGYPAGMTSWLVPQKHAHAGFWCGDKYAVADFQSQMKSKFKTLKALNARWGTAFKQWDHVTQPVTLDDAARKQAWNSKKSTDMRRWLDFMDWYNGFWVRFVPGLCGVIRESYPKNQQIVSIGYGAEKNYFGNDVTRLVQMAKKTKIALQTPGNVSYYSQKRVSTACRFYGVPYYTEPPGDVQPNDEMRRLYNDIANGISVFFDYPPNMDRVRPQLKEYKDFMTGAQPVVDFAIFNSTINFRLEDDGAYPGPAYLLGEGSEQYDYDVVDETLINDGVLKHYRVMAYVYGNTTEQSSLKKIAEWVKQGGALITSQMGTVSSVEGGSSVWRSLVPSRMPDAASLLKGDRWDWPEVIKQCSRRVGKGIVIQLPVKPTNLKPLVDGCTQAIYNLKQAGNSFRNAPLIDDQANGFRAVLLTDRIVFYTWMPDGVDTIVKLRPEDWVGRKRPAQMEFRLKMAPHTLSSVRLVDPSTSRVLSNTHNLVTWMHGQNYLFNGCMQYLMECLGADKQYDYWFFSGVTGDSFTQVYRPDWSKFTSCLSQDAFSREMAKKAFDACGYEFQYVDKAELQAHKSRYIKKIVNSINAGIPVISRTNDDGGQFSAICGYEDNGKTLLFMEGDKTEPTRYTDGLSGKTGSPLCLVFAGKKKTAPPIADVYRQAVMNIPHQITLPAKDGLVFGKAAFDSWADALRNNDFTGVPDDKMDTWKIQGTYICIAGTNGCSRGYIKKALELNPDMVFINKLAPIFERQQMLFESMLSIGGGFEITKETLRNQELKLPIIAKIREFSKCCDEIMDVFASQK